MNTLTTITYKGAGQKCEANTCRVIRNSGKTPTFLGAARMVSRQLAEQNIIIKPSDIVVLGVEMATYAK